MKRILPKRVPSPGHLHRCHNRPETLQIQGTNHLWISSKGTSNTSAAWKSALETLFSACRILDDLLVGCSRGCYRVVGNKISTCKSALITAQLWLVRPRGRLGEHVNCPAVVWALVSMVTMVFPKGEGPNALGWLLAKLVDLYERVCIKSPVSCKPNMILLFCPLCSEVIMSTVVDGLNKK